MRRAIPIVVALIVLIPVCDVFALMENRPANTSEPTLLKQGKFLVATGATFLKQPNADKEWDWVSDIECGVFDWFEYDIELPHVSKLYDDDRIVTADDNGDEVVSKKKNNSGIGDVAMTWAFGAVKERELIPAITLACTLKTKSGNAGKDLGTGKNDVSAALLMMKKFGKLSAVVNVGYKFVGKPDDADVRNTVSNNYMIKYEISEKLTAVAEIYGETNQDRAAARDPWNMLGGVIYNISDSLAFDCGVGTGLNSESPALRVTSGLSYSF
ncbi:MAG TPA: transporter [bacterium]|nr:transporter [bacterium]